jgi:hypothetical protein
MCGGTLPRASGTFVAPRHPRQILKRTHQFRTHDPEDLIITLLTRHDGLNQELQADEVIRALFKFRAQNLRQVPILQIRG